jgi:phosphoglycerate dehydrogenase-like enzyme
MNIKWWRYNWDKMKIYLITSNPRLTVAMKDRLEKVGDLVVIDAAKKMSVDEIVSKAGDAEILIAGSSGVEVISKEVMLGLKKLKMIATLTVGVAWVDVESAKELGITVCNIKGANAESVAEHAWGMILDLSKRISEFDRDVRNKGAFEFAKYTGREVYGKTIGIIGLGDIGQKVARIAKGFDMKILGFNRSKKDIENVEQVDFKKLLNESDVIVLCVPLTDQTVKLISEEEISQMKDGVILINPAMENIVDKKAVLDAVNCGKIYGFGVETDIMKQIPVDDPYLKHPRILVTPHNAFNTEDANVKSYELVIENIEKFIRGEPQNVV